MTPTEELNAALIEAFNMINEEFFQGQIEQTLITLQRKKNSEGSFSIRRWAKDSIENTEANEISINPVYFAKQTLAETMANIAHQMVHLWQASSGKPGRGGYHNQEYIEKLNSIGIDGKTGDNAEHRIIPNGRFDIFVKTKIPSEYSIRWLDRAAVFKYEENENLEEPKLNSIESEEVAKKQLIISSGEEIKGEVEKGSGGSRTKYTCPNGHYSVWGKKNINPMCGNCREFMIVEVST